MPLNLNRLNPNQKAAVLHGDGPLLILAGAGSGKTSTMTYRIAHLVAERHVSPSAILGLSFTNKAATELKERVAKLIKDTLGPRASRGLTVTTFHSLCARILRAHGEKLGFSQSFTIVDEGDQKDILKQVFRNINIDDRKFDLDVILSEFSQAKSRLLSADQAEAFFTETGRLKEPYDVAAASSFARYQEQLKVLNAMDFDDLMYHVVHLLKHHADVREHYNAKFRYILVDEYQDTNPTQFQILHYLTQRQQNICVVGDDDQSIYSWRGADATHILEFSRHFPGAHTIVLDQNYRSTSRILEAANKVIANNKVRHAKSLWSDRGEGEPITEVILDEDREEAEYVAEEIGRRAREQNRLWKDFAVLYRSNTQARIFEEALRRHKIPYKIVGGQSFLDRKEVKNVLSYWRLIVNPHDDASLRRIHNWPSRGIGKSSMEALGDHAFQNKTSVFDAFEHAPTIAPRGAPGATALRSMLQTMRSDLESLPPGSPEALADWGRRCLAKIEAKRAIEEENKDDPIQAAKRWEIVEELVHALGQTKVEDPELPSGPLDTLQEFLNRMALQAQEEEDKNKDKDGPESQQNQVTLLTLHGSKGLEYPIVFLVGMEEGFLPHRRTIDGAEDFSEERRLAYVGITRARDHLILTRAKNRIRYGKPVPRYRSRFLEEIPSDLITLIDRSFPDENSSADHRKAHEEKVLGHLSNIRALLSQASRQPRGQ